MYPAKIDSYHRPGTLDEALSMLSSGDDEVLCLAGGMSLMQAIKARLARPSALIDLQSVSDIAGISATDTGLRIGAMTRYVDIAASKAIGPAHAALIDAAGHVGDRQVRNRGTIGGSLCWNYILACMPVVALTLDARMELASAGSASRTLQARDFLIGPLETDRRADELLTAVHFPDQDGAGSAYRKWGPTTDALPSVGVAIWLAVGPGGRCRKARLAATGMTEGARLFEAAGAAIEGLGAGDTQEIAAALEQAADQADFPADSWGSADHKRMRLKTIGADLVQTAFRRAARTTGGE